MGLVNLIRTLRDGRIHGIGEILKRDGKLFIVGKDIPERYYGHFLKKIGSGARRMGYWNSWRETQPHNCGEKITFYRRREGNYEFRFKSFDSIDADLDCGHIDKGAY